jgi:hypothetical protein
MVTRNCTSAHDRNKHINKGDETAIRKVHLSIFTNGQRIKLTNLRYTTRFSEKARSEAAHFNFIPLAIVWALQVFRATACAGESLDTYGTVDTPEHQCRHIYLPILPNLPPSYRPRH